MVKKKETGLTEESAAALLKKYGPNELIEKPPKPLWIRFFEQFKDFLIIVLLVAAAISAALGEMVDAALIGLIVILHALLSLAQEYKAEKAFEALKKLVAPTTRVLRNGEVKVIDVRSLVPGDIVLLEAGDKVPADGSVLESTALAADEASLTGESTPVEKTKNLLLFMGTVIVRGKGMLKVERTGMSTEMGRIAALVQEVEKERTPIEIDLEKMGKQLALGVLLLCGVIFTLGILHGFELLNMFIVSVSLAVAAIPEGLPAVVAIVLAVGVQRMAKRNAIVRKLKAVETLGCANVICTDKTGTLTKNEMTIKKMWVNGRLLDVSGIGYNPTGSFSYKGEPASLGKEEKLLLRTGVLCNSSYLREDLRTGWGVVGDPTEGALLVAGAKAGLWKEELSNSYTEIVTFPFDSVRKRMTVVCMDKKMVAYTKGAPEIVLKLSGFIAEKDKVRRLKEADKKDINKINDQLTSNGYRTLALAYKELLKKPSSAESAESDLVFLGLVAMIDAPREEVKGALELCRSAGIRVIMITGDHPLTAKAVAEELGISNGKILTGEDLNSLSDEEFNEMVEEVAVYARVSPSHKLRIVNALNAKGHVVAMTGDGVNDAPALKKSDIGVAMGVTGTDVAKESSDMVLADDNFATIVAAVEEGRGAYDNIKRTVAYLLSGNIAEVAIITLAILLGMPLPLIAIQILWINLVTDGLPAVALALEPVDDDVMRRPPRRRGESIWKGTHHLIIEAPIIVTAFSVGTFAFTFAGDLIRAQTLVFTLLMMFEKMLAFNARSLEKPILHSLTSNKWLVLTALLTLGMHLAILYIPPLAALFHVKPLGLVDWVIIIVLSLTLFLYIEARKWLSQQNASKSPM